MSNSEKKRIAHPKVKSGCKTCKARRVKCDETHPECMKCIKLGRDCGGYQPLASKRAAVSRNRGFPTTHQLLPKTGPASGLIPASLAAGIKFQNERERAYFRLYQDEVSSELASGFDSTLWNQIVLQACEDPSILGLTTAIAALRKAGKLTRMGRRNRETNFHIEEALKLYGKALKGIRIMLSKGQRDDLRIVLIAALLIFCVENLHGDTKQAMRHIQTTLQLIQQKLRLFAPGTPLSVPLPGPCQSNNSLIEDEIMQPFSTNFFCVDRRIPVLEYGASAARFFLEHRDVPEQFFTIAEARNFADRIRCQLTTRGGYVFETFEREDERPSVHGPADVLLDRLSEAALHDSAPRILAQLQQWNKAFTSLLERGHRNASTFIAVTTLSVQILAINISLRSFTSIMDDFDPFAETVRLLAFCEEIVAHPKFSKSFVFDVGIIPPLWLMIVLCPDMNLKKKGVKILRDMEPRAECVWNSGVIADDADTLIASLERKQRAEPDGTDSGLPNSIRGMTEVTCYGGPSFLV